MKTAAGLPLALHLENCAAMLALSETGGSQAKQTALNANIVCWRSIDFCVMWGCPH